MELFKITCVTCKARLSVRNPEIIGQIVACPRCNSMVQVQPPQGAPTSTMPEPVESAAETPPAPAPEHAQSEPEGVRTEEVSLQANAAVAKYQLVAWTLASFVVGAAIGGAVLLLRGTPPISGVETSQVVTSPEAVVEKTLSEDVPREALIENIEESPVESVEPTVSERSDQSRLQSEETKAEEPNELETTAPVPEPVAEEAVEGPPPVEETREPRVASRFNALDIDPANVDLEMFDSPPGERSLADPENADSTDVVLEETAEASVESTLPAARRDPQQLQNKETPSAAERLVQVIPALKVKSMPLGDYLVLNSRLGGVPISIAPGQLQMAGITADHEVSLDAKEISLAEALNRVLGPLHLELTTDGTQAIVVREEATKRRAIEYPLDDLVNATTSVDALVGWVRQFVVPLGASPLEELPVMETKGTSLRIEQRQEFQYQVLLFLERLRLARGVPPRSRFPVKQLAGVSALESLAGRLDAPTTFTFSHYTQLDEIVRYWQREVGVPVLVDWPALAKLDLWPDSNISCAIENKSWQQALDTTLEPLGLGWRAAAGGVIEITIAEKVHTELQLELYQLRQDLGGDTEKMLAALRSIASERSGAIEYDSAGKVLLVLQPAAGQRLVWQRLVDEKLVAGD